MECLLVHSYNIYPFSTYLVQLCQQRSWKISNHSEYYCRQLHQNLVLILHLAKLHWSQGLQRVQALSVHPQIQYSSRQSVPFSSNVNLWTFFLKPTCSMFWVLYLGSQVLPNWLCTCQQFLQLHPLLSCILKILTIFYVWKLLAFKQMCGCLVS